MSPELALLFLNRGKFFFRQSSLCRTFSVIELGKKITKILFVLIINVMIRETDTRTFHALFK